MFYEIIKGKKKTMDDIFDLLESKEKPFQQESGVSNSTGGDYNKRKFDKSKEPNLWDATDIKPVKIVMSELSTAKKTFSMAVYTGKNELPVAIKEKMLELLKVLSAKGYIYRHSAGSLDGLQEEFIATEGLKVESYLPWKKFNEGIKSPVLVKPNEFGYGVAVNNRNKFYELAPHVRALYAKDTHMLLGDDCKKPLEFLVIYTTCGTEALTKKTDYSTIGSLGYLLRIAAEANIPVFNLKNESAMSNIIAIIKKHTNEAI